jgi:hypothetical protein
VKNVAPKRKRKRADDSEKTSELRLGKPLAERNTFTGWNRSGIKTLGDKIRDVL